MHFTQNKGTSTVHILPPLFSTNTPPPLPQVFTVTLWLPFITRSIARACSHLDVLDQRVTDAVNVRQELDLRVGEASSFPLLPSLPGPATGTQEEKKYAVVNDCVNDITYECGLSWDMFMWLMHVHAVQLVFPLCPQVVPLHGSRL